MLRLLLISVFAFSSLGMHAQEVLGFSLADGKKRVEIPIEIHNNLIVVPVVLNGQLPLKFILDTGVRTAILTQKAFSDILNLSYARHYVVAGPGGKGIAEAYVTNNVSFDMPGVSGKGHAMLVLEEDYLELRNYLGTDVHGIIGYELFSRFIVQVDYERRRLVLMLPERFKPGRKFQSLPLLIEDTKPYVFANLEMNDSTKVKAKLLIDSGASHGLILETESDGKIRAPQKHIKSIIGRGLGGVITGQIGRVKSLSMADYKISNVLANFPDPNSYNDTLKASRNVFRNGAIGGEILSRFDVIFDFPREKIYFKKNSSFKKPFFYNLSGLTLKAEGSRLRKYKITDVRENSSAARAGLQNGDLIIFINGLLASDLGLNDINGFFNSRPGRRIRLEIERDGQKLKKEFHLEAQI